MADAANDIEEHGLTRTLKDLFAGAVGGIAQVLLGMFVTHLHLSPASPRELPNQSVFYCTSRSSISRVSMVGDLECILL